MTLTQILTQCENELGWVPRGKELWKARATMHMIMTRAMQRQGISEADLQLTVNWCKRRRLPIASPLELLPLVVKAIDAAPAQIKPHPLDVQVAAAIAWEQARQDTESSYWAGRLINSNGPSRADVLSEWASEGRGQ